MGKKLTDDELRKRIDALEAELAHLRAGIEVGTDGK